MAKETAKDAAGVASSKSETQSQALTTTGDGDVSGPLALALSSETQDRLMQELQEAMHQVAEGFGNLVAPGEVAKQGLPFDVIDAITIPDYVDQRTGEEKAKHIFKLQFGDGRVVMTMQSDARPRRVLASMFQKARALGQRLKAGPYLYEQKSIVGQIQPAFVFAQQQGFAIGKG
jgi:hypothetical protein